MKAIKILNTEKTNIGYYVEVKYDDLGKPKMVYIPKKLQDKPVHIKDGQLRIGKYAFNPETNTWEKISRILLFLQQVVELIKNFLSK